jgi:predicted GTPase
MAETVAQQLARLQLDVQNLHAQLQSKTQATKDLSMVTLINRWSGTEKSQLVNDFFDSIEASARVGNWSDADK